MGIEVCSFELALRLKELGADQDSLYCWITLNTGAVVVRKRNKHRMDLPAAYLGEELYELVPDWIPGFRQYEFEWEKTGKDFLVYYQHGKILFDDPIKASTYEDAMAKLLLYLVENKFLVL